MKNYDFRDNLDEAYEVGYKEGVQYKSKILLDALEEISSYTTGGSCYDGLLDIIQEIKEIAKQAIKDYDDK